MPWLRKPNDVQEMLSPIHLFATEPLELRGDLDGALFYRVLKNGKTQAGRLSDQAIYNVVKKRQKEAGEQTT